MYSVVLRMGFWGNKGEAAEEAINTNVGTSVCEVQSDCKYTWLGWLDLLFFEGWDPEAKRASMIAW